MLYNNGDQFNQIYYNGKPVSQIWKNGVCIYPNYYDTVPLLKNNYIWGTYSSTITSIIQSDSLPTGVSLTDISNNGDLLSVCWVSGDFPDLLGQYDYNSTYSIGDVVIYNTHIYTCIRDMSSPGDFIYDNWVTGYYPDILGIYDPEREYNPGDVICYKDNYNYQVYTCRYSIELEVFNSDHWVSGYYPELTGNYQSSITYHLGDVVYYDGSIYTC